VGVNKIGTAPAERVTVGSAAWATKAYDVVHINSEFATHLSDHDPSVARLTF
jgi:hypothetical protein